MSERVKPIGMDNKGFDILKNAVVELLNQFPGLNGLEVSRSDLPEDGGMTMYPDGGALIYSERTDICGNVSQVCQMQCLVVYRTGATSEFAKAKANDLLDEIGAWVCREPVTVDGEDYQLDEYPRLTGNRTITAMSRSNSYAMEPNPNKTQDWVLPVTVTYKHEFTRP